MTKYIFAIHKNDLDENGAYTSPFDVMVSTKAYFQQEQSLQDDYYPNDYDELTAIMEKNELSEAMESIYEPNDETISIEAVTAKLNSEPLFSYSQDFQDYVDKD